MNLFCVQYGFRRGGVTPALGVGKKGFFPLCGKGHQALYTKTVLWVGTGHIQKSGQTMSPTVDGSGPPKGKRREVPTCFAWNDGRTCASVPCRFQHACYWVIIGRWPVFRQERGLLCPQLPSKHLGTGSSSKS